MSGGREFRPGDRLRTDTRLADDEGSVDRGTTGRVIGDQHTQRGSDGVERVQIQRPDGTIVAVPTNAVRRA